MGWGSREESKSQLEGVYLFIYLFSSSGNRTMGLCSNLGHILSPLE
jgi:hypothetical protein